LLFGLLFGDRWPTHHPRVSLWLVNHFLMWLVYYRTDSVTSSRCEGVNQRNTQRASFASICIPFSATIDLRPSTWSFDALCWASVSGFLW
jgi:hypothetical protein